MPISLKKAYSACLWLAERKLGIPVNEQRGEWDLEAKDKALDWKREELVTALPYDYFEHSLYDYHGTVYEDEEIEVNFDETPQENEESNDFLTQQEQWESISNKVHSELTAKDNIIEDSRTYRHCVDLSNIADGHLFIDEFLNHFVRYSPQRTTGFDSIDQWIIDKAETIPHNPLPYLSLDDAQNISENLHAQASVIAHKTLLELLTSEQISAWGYIDITDLSEALTQGDEYQASKEFIETSFWDKKPIPNYEISAIEHGINRIHKIISVIQDSNIIENNLNMYDCWIKKIHISDNFKPWLMEKVREVFPTPKAATFKPQGKGYLVQFGTDKPTEVKSNSGIKIIYKLLKNHHTPEYREDFGYSIEMMGMDELQEDVSNYETSTLTERGKSSNIKGYIRKQHSLMFWKLEQLKTYQLELEKTALSDEANIHSSRGADITKKSKQSILNSLHKIHAIEQDETQCFDKVSLQVLIDLEPSTFISKRAEMKKLVSIELSEEEKSIDNIRNTINFSMKGLRKVAPHFAYFLGSVKSKSPNGIGYDKDLFYFASKDDIQWDFGD
ncbi:MAG: hypothetical protein ACI88H_001617 [Cocleimonas sp.]|jgi:hypothetical protein